MKSVVERKCNACKNVVKIDRENASDVIYFKKLYYHKQCFIEMAERKSKQKRGSKQQWVDALENLKELEDATKQMLVDQMLMVRDTDELNNYLLQHYNVTTIDSRFWQIVRDLGNGIYRNKRCKKVDLDTLYGAWVWGQRKLDDINKFNKQNNKGPKTDGERLFYDIAIIVKHLDDYKKHQDREKSKKEEIASMAKNNIAINYDTLNKMSQSKEQEDILDISALLDEIF